MNREPSGRSARAQRLVLRAGAPVVRALDRLDRRGPPALSILMYHRVLDAADLGAADPTLVSATPAGFARQMELLAGTRPLLSLADLLAVRRGERELPRRAAMVTFDDAYRDVADHAWPVLRRLGIPCTVFVPTAFPDGREPEFWWDAIHAAMTTTSRTAPLPTPAGRLPLGTPAERAASVRVLRDWIVATPHEAAMDVVRSVCDELGAPPAESRVLGWDELRGLRDAGVQLASHTQTHPILSQVEPERVRQEIERARADLERELGACPPALAFPVGGSSAAVREIAAEEGIELAFTTERGINRRDGISWLALRRINVGRRATPEVIQAQMLPWVDRARERLRR